jgi:MFS family permease
MGLVGAMFGVAFALGPVIGGLLAGFGLQAVGFFSAAALFVDFLLIAFILPDSRVHSFHTHSGDVKPEKKPFPLADLLPVFVVSFVVAFGFSGMQSTFGLLIPDRYHVGQEAVGYLLGVVGVTSILYQAFFIKLMRKVFLEKGLILFGLVVMAVGFALLSVNPFLWLVVASSMMFSVGFGSVNASTSALISRIAPGHAGRALGTNGSVMALANIFGPILAGALYGLAPIAPALHGFWTYAASASLFVIGLPIAFLGISSRHPIFARDRVE